MTLLHFDDGSKVALEYSEHYAILEGNDFAIVLRNQF